MGTDSQLDNARAQHLPQYQRAVTLTLDQLADLTYESVRRYLSGLSGLKAGKAREHAHMIAARALLDVAEYADPHDHETNPPTAGRADE